MPRKRTNGGVQSRQLDERFALSYQPKAPDHGRPELALVDRGEPRWRYAIIAVGEKATQLWGLDAFPNEVLERAKAELRGEGVAG